MIISMVAEKALDKSQHTFIFLKSLDKIETKRNVLNVINYTCVYI